MTSLVWCNHPPDQPKGCFRCDPEAHAASWLEWETEQTKLHRQGAEAMREAIIATLSSLFPAPEREQLVEAIKAVPVPKTPTKVERLRWR